MRAIVQHAYGPAEVLRVEEIDRPRIGADEVLVRVHAAGLDRGTWHLMTGTPYLVRAATGLRGPRNPIPGRDLAGTVVAAGAAVTRFAVGDEVFGIGSGTFAEYAAAPASKLVRKPAGLSFAEAAVVPISGITALVSVRDAGRVTAGQRVLITGASGGVGSFAVQIARALGAEVTAECSGGKADLVRKLGADHVLDHTEDSWSRYDVIIDIAGNPSVTRLRGALTAKGTAVIVGGEHGGAFSGGMSRQLRALALSPFVGQRLTMTVPQERGAHVEDLAELIGTGQLVPALDRTYPLDRAAEAMRYLASGQVRGKVAVEVTAA